jgi:hypothetical protein
VKPPTLSDSTFRLRFEFSEPVAWTSALRAALLANNASSSDGSSSSSGVQPAAAAAPALNETLILTDARLVNLSADTATAAPLTFYVAGGSGGGAAAAAVAAAAASAFEADFEAPAGAAARVVVPGGSYQDGAGNTGATDADVTVRGRAARWLVYQQSGGKLCVWPDAADI